MTESVQGGAERPCWLGVSRDEGATRLRLEPSALLRHVMALGSSGSGKTVLAKILTEEVLRLGVPVIAIDPQGDLCSLALAAADPQALAARGIDPAVAERFSQSIDPVIWTPASRAGAALCADPVRADVAKLPASERAEAISGIATMIAALLGYDLSSDEGEGLVAVFDRALQDRLELGRFPRRLDDFAQWFVGLGEAELEPYARYIAPRKIVAAAQKLARLDVGTRRLLFHEGLPLDIDLLLGRGTGSGAIKGRTRLSIIYLNTLDAQDDKEFFLAALADRLYGWMLQHPSPELQALFYIDEVAPFIPPVRKPACKPALQLLFKQARKYGVGCLMATQNPGDVDYRAMAQFGTWALGRLTTRQDMKKIEPTVKSLDPTNVEAIMEELPRQKPGEFVLLSPDQFDRAARLATRWLYTRHETLDEEAIRRLADESFRARFEALEAQRAPEPARVETPVPPRAPVQARAPAADPAEPAAPPEADEAPDELVPSAREEELARALEVIRRKGNASARELSADLEISDSKARSLLKRLSDDARLKSFKEGRALRYFAADAPLRPDLRLYAKVSAIAPRLSESAAHERAERLRRKRVLGLFGAGEATENIVLVHRLILRCTFEEQLPRGVVQRLLGSDGDLLLDHVYLHPRTLEVLGFHPVDGLEVRLRPEGPASGVQDFDGQVTFESRWPGELSLDEDEWLERADDEDVFERFSQRFAARPKAVEPIALPVWRFSFRDRARHALRLVTVDALAGRSLPW